MSAVFRWSEFEAEGQSTCSLTGLSLLRLRIVGSISVVESIVLKRGRVGEIDASSAKVIVRTGGTTELAEPERAWLLDSTRAAEETECDRNRLSTIASPEGVCVSLLRVDIIKLSACKWRWPGLWNACFLRLRVILDIIVTCWPWNCHSMTDTNFKPCSLWDCDKTISINRCYWWFTKKNTHRSSSLCTASKSIKIWANTVMEICVLCGDVFHPLLSSDNHDCQCQIYGADDAVCLVRHAIRRAWFAHL